MDTSTQFTFTSDKSWYRALKDGSDIYVAGDNIVGYTTFGAKDSLVNLVPGIARIQDVYIYENNLYATNWVDNNWGMARIGDGPVPLTTASQSITPVWPLELVTFVDGVTFFEEDGVKYAYVGDEDQYQLSKFKYNESTWERMYVTSEDLAQMYFTTQIFYSNGDGTNTIILASNERIYKTTDTGSAFTPLTMLYEDTTSSIKGIAWVPTAIAVPAPIAEPISSPVEMPVAEPMSEPMAEPMSEPMAEPMSEPMAEPMSEPASEPTSKPMTSVPIGDVPVGGPMTTSEPLTNNVPVASTPQKAPTGKVSAACSLIGQVATIALSTSAISVLLL